MDIFNNCRLCLQSINHEPIRITRSLLRFLKDDLRMENIVRQSGPANGKQQKLCASCFNKLSEFQDFLEQCREADDFWKNQFSRDESSNAQQEQPKENEDNYICVSDVSSSKPTETKLETEFQEDDEDDELLLSLAVPDDDGMEQQNTGHIENETTCDEDEIHVDAFDAPDQEDEWPEDENESIMDLENVSSAPDKFVPDQEIIQYEYELPKENSEGNEFLANSRQITITDEEETETTETQTQTFSYEDVEGDDDSCTLLQESINDMLRSTSSNSETTLERTAASSSTYILTTVLDDNGKVKKSYQCQHCERSFDRIYDIESHFNIHTDVKPFKCNVCNKSFRQKNILTTHQALPFGKKVECTECGKKFARRSQLILHFRMHRDEKPFVCSFGDCQAAFRQRQHLVDHSFIHTGEKNFPCSTCNKAFQTRKRLQDHIYKVHSYHRYSCDRCEKTFLKPHMLKNHLSSAHKEEGVQDVSHLKITIDQIKTIKK